MNQQEEIERVRAENHELREALHLAQEELSQVKEALRLALAKLPVYRLRWALSELWTQYPPRWTACHPYRVPTRITWPPGSMRWWMTCWNLLDLPIDYCH